MAYLPELHYCCVCGVYLGMDDGDGICSDCEDAIPEEGYSDIELEGEEMLSDGSVERGEFDH